MILLPLGAAALGYFTNLLAIAMLFRPHEEKRIFGLKVPFTPGLIPKERGMLAKKIGATFKGKVLTDNVLEEMLTNPEMLEKLDALVVNLIRHVFENEQTIKDILGNQKADELILLAAERLEYGADKLLADERKLAEVLPGNITTQLISSMGQHSDKISIIAEKILSNPKVTESGRDLIAKIAKEHVGGLAGLFVNPDKIFESMRTGVIDYLGLPENYQTLFSLVSEHGSKLLDWRICDITQKLSSLPIEELANAAKTPVDRLLYKILHTPISEILSKIPDITRKKITDQLNLLMRKAIATAAPRIIASIDIAKVIEDRINGFETREMERILLDVVRKQLSMIAMLGGILGFIIGLIPVLLM